MNYCEAVDDPAVFGPWFGGESWHAWSVVERAIFGLPIAGSDLPLFAELTGRAEDAPTEPCSEAWVVAGRRSGKSRKAAALAVYLATIGVEVLGWRSKLAPGEVGSILVLAVSKDQAKVVLGYVRAFFDAVPMFKSLVVRDVGDGLDLANKISLTVTANDFRSIRGRTVCAAIFDEVSFWRSELTVNPDVETYRAIKPAMATVQGSLLVGISSPYRRSGLLWQKFRRHWGKAGPVLIVRAPTTTLNPLVDRQVIADALEDDPAAARAEWLGEFRQDLADYISREVVEGLVSPGIHERAPVRAPYYAFCDPAGGSGSDSFTLAIASKRGECAQLDVLRERRPPFNPEQVVEEFCQVLRRYSIARVEGDHFAGEWPADAFRRRGVAYVRSDRTKSQIYLESLALLNAGEVDLLDDDRLVAQICGLERRTARGGRDSVDHGPNGHDDLCNACLGALLGARARQKIRLIW